MLSLVLLRPLLVRVVALVDTLSGSSAVLSSSNPSQQSQSYSVSAARAEQQPQQETSVADDAHVLSNARAARPPHAHRQRQHQRTPRSDTPAHDDRQDANAPNAIARLTATDESIGTRTQSRAPPTRPTTHRVLLRSNRNHRSRLLGLSGAAAARDEHSVSQAQAQAEASALEHSQAASFSDTASTSTRPAHITRKGVAVAACSRSIYSALYAYPLLALIFIVLSGIICMCFLLIPAHFMRILRCLTFSPKILDISSNNPS